MRLLRDVYTRCEGREYLTSQVNEELVKAKANGGGDKTRSKVKRPKVVMAAHCGGGRGRGGHEGEEFNFGTHTAKRATLRARKGELRLWRRCDGRECAVGEAMGANRVAAFLGGDRVSVQPCCEELLALD